MAGKNTDDDNNCWFTTHFLHPTQFWWMHWMHLIYLFVLGNVVNVVKSNQEWRQSFQPTMTQLLNCSCDCFSQQRSKSTKWMVVDTDTNDTATPKRERERESTGWKLRHLIQVFEFAGDTHWGDNPAVNSTSSRWQLVFKIPISTKSQGPRESTH